MNNIPETIQQTLEVLSAKFGVGIENLWEIMVRQQIFEARAHLFFGCILFVVVLGCVVGFIWALKIGNDDMAFGITMIGLIFLVITCIFFYASYLEFVNPEYQAIKEFLEVFKVE